MSLHSTIRFSSMIGYALCHGCYAYRVRESERSWSGTVLVAKFDDLDKAISFAEKARTNSKQNGVTIRRTIAGFAVSAPVVVEGNYKVYRKSECIW